MDKNEYFFPEVTNSLLISTINNQFIKKKPKIGISKELKNIKVEKIDGEVSEINNSNKFIYTKEQCIELNNNNIISYKSLEPKNKLIYTDTNKEEEKNKINTPINYDFLLNIIQIDNTSTENDIDGNNGKFIENFTETESNDEIIFDSLFEEGNLRMAINIENNNVKEYDILMRKDYNNDKNYSWFYFSIKCKNEGNYKFNILNFIKKKISFNNNTSVKVLSYNKNDKWNRNTYNVFYYPNSIPINPLFPNNNNLNKNIINLNSEDDEKEKDEINNNNSNSTFYTLTFTYYVTKENLNIPIYFSYCYPYTYTTLQDYLHSLSINPKNKMKIKFSKLNKSISGNPLDVLYITNFNSSFKDLENRQIIIFTSRVHPGETVGSYVIEGVINSLLEEKNNHLLKKYIFKIIPMLNPDGVINGCYRNNLLGLDLNRMWNDPKINICPTIFYTKNFICINKTLFFCDFHGHSKMPNCALYGCSPKKKKVNGKIILIAQECNKSYHWFEEKVFMKIFEEEAKYYQSSGEQFFISKSKLKTARAIAYNEFQISFSYTLETSTMNVTEKIINNNNNSNNLNNDIVSDNNNHSSQNNINLNNNKILIQNNSSKNKISNNNKLSINNVLNDNINLNQNSLNHNNNNLNYNNTSNNNINNNNINNINIVNEGITIKKLYLIGSDFVNAFVKWDNKTKFYGVLKKIRNEEEEKKVQKEKEKSLSTSPGIHLSFTYRNNKKRNKKSLNKIMHDDGRINKPIDRIKNCKTIISPKPENNSNSLFNKYNFI